MKNNIFIGFAGQKQSGKTTASDMTNFIIKHYKSFNHYPKYIDYVTYNLKNHIKPINIINFASKLKDYCSEIFNINRKHFDDNDYKENKVYSITNLFFIDRKNLDTNIYHEITIDDLQKCNNNLMDCRLMINNTYNKSSVISLRTIMQYIGTNIFRNMISRDIWIDMTIKHAERLLHDYEYCIIGDVRFRNECNAIKENNGIVIKIDRNNDNNINHESEIIDFKCDYIINNNSSKEDLFNNILSIIKSL